MTPLITMSHSNIDILSVRNTLEHFLFKQNLFSFQSFMMLGVENLTLNGIYMAQLIGISVGGAIATLAIKKISYVYILLMIIF